MELSDIEVLFNILWKKKVTIILIVILFCALGFGYTMYYVKPVYKSYTSVVLAQTGTEKPVDVTMNDYNGSITYSDVTLNSKLIGTYRELVKSHRVLEPVINNLRLDIKEEKLKKNIKVSDIEDTDMLKIEVTNSDPKMAAKIADEVANVFISEVDQIYNIRNVKLVDKAQIDLEPSNINHPKDIVIFGLIGMVIGVMHALIVNLFDNTIKDENDIDKILDVPTLATIPEFDIDEKKVKGGRRTNEKRITNI